MEAQSSLFGVGYEGEDWCAVSGWESRYMVSSFGRVASKERVIRRNDRWGNSGVAHKRGRQLLSPSAVGDSGHLQVRFYKNNDGEQVEKAFLVHRLVARHFLGKPPTTEAVVNHIDGDPQNNCVGNLEWVEHWENRLHGLLKKSLQEHGQKSTRQRIEEWASALS